MKNSTKKIITLTGAFIAFLCFSFFVYAQTNQPFFKKRTSSKKGGVFVSKSVPKTNKVEKEIKDADDSNKLTVKTQKSKSALEAKSKPINLSLEMVITKIVKAKSKINFMRANPSEYSAEDIAQVEKVLERLKELEQSYITTNEELEETVKSMRSSKVRKRTFEKDTEELYSILKNKKIEKKLMPIEKYEGDLTKKLPTNHRKKRVSTTNIKTQIRESVDYIEILPESEKQ